MRWNPLQSPDDPFFSITMEWMTSILVKRRQQKREHQWFGSHMLPVQQVLPYSPSIALSLTLEQFAILWHKIHRDQTIWTEASNRCSQGRRRPSTACALVDRIDVENPWGNPGKASKYVGFSTSMWVCRRVIAVITLNTVPWIRYYEKYYKIP